MNKSSFALTRNGGWHFSLRQLRAADPKRNKALVPQLQAGVHVPSRDRTRRPTSLTPASQQLLTHSRARRHFWSPDGLPCPVSCARPSSSSWVPSAGWHLPGAAVKATDWLSSPACGPRGGLWRSRKLISALSHSSLSAAVILQGLQTFPQTIPFSSLIAVIA